MNLRSLHHVFTISLQKRSQGNSANSNLSLKETTLVTTNPMFMSKSQDLTAQSPTSLSSISNALLTRGHNTRCLEKLKSKLMITHTRPLFTRGKQHQKIILPS